MSFLNAEWRKLAIANYEVDQEVLTPYLPYKTELDTWNGRHFVSLIGFMFVNVRLLGIKIPFHTNFEEVNLRFYVRYKEGDNWKRGVVFIKEIVPKSALTFVANTIYGEHYETAKMRHLWEENPSGKKIQYEWESKGQWQSFAIESSPDSSLILPDSETEFITEHYWGYTRINPEKTFEYEVTHPRWEAYTVKDYKIEVDFGTVYGKDFERLNHQQPVSVMLAEGSEITVEGKKRI